MICSTTLLTLYIQCVIILVEPVASPRAGGGGGGKYGNRMRIEERGGGGPTNLR